MSGDILVIILTVTVFLYIVNFGVMLWWLIDRAEPGRLWRRTRRWAKIVVWPLVCLFLLPGLTVMGIFVGAAPVITLAEKAIISLYRLCKIAIFKY